MREVLLPNMVTGSAVSVGRPMWLSAKEALNDAYLVGQHQAEGYADQPGYHREAVSEAFKAISHEPKGRGDAHGDQHHASDRPGAKDQQIRDRPTGIPD